MQKSEAGLPEMRSKEKDKEVRKKAWGAYFNMWGEVSNYTIMLCELNHTFKETTLKEITTMIQWTVTQAVI